MFSNPVVIFFFFTFQLTIGWCMQVFHHEGKIVGGSVVRIENFPYQVSLQQPTHFCGGSIIGTDWVLTAAHCGSIGVVGQLKVRLGSSTWDQGGDLIDAALIIIHPQYNANSLTHDFSLVRLAQHVTFSSIARPVHLVPANFQILAGAVGTVSGWGETQDLTVHDTQLRAVALPIVARQRCNLTYQFLGGVDGTMICAGYVEGGRDSCFGDSGGPLVTTNGLQMGVVSWGVECAAPNLPGVYGRVSVVREWIKITSGI